jgi:DNA-binding transcriptional LysR family regulator
MNLRQLEYFPPSPTKAHSRAPVESLGWEEFVLVLPEGDPLLERQSVPLSKLADRRWVHFVRGHGLAELVDLCCATAGFSPRVALRTSQVAAAPQFAAAGVGPALVPSHVVPDAFQRIARPRVTALDALGRRLRWRPVGADHRGIPFDATPVPTSN